MRPRALLDLTRPSPAALALGLVAAAGVAATAASAQTPAPADLVLQHGQVYTMDAARSWAQAVAIAHGRIVWVGTDSAAAPWIGPSTRVIDLAGKMVLPSFHDSHVHPIQGGMALLQCDLSGLTSADLVYAKVKACATSHPEDSWIVGGGWELPLFPAANPRKEDLDRLVPDRPVYLSAADGHSAWVNSKALAVAGVTAATPDPPEGRIERDPKTGEPTGTLRESAKDLVSRHIPPETDAQYREALRRALEMANQFGITDWVEANASERMLETYMAADSAGWLTARVLAAQHVEPSRGTAQIPGLVARRTRFHSPHLRATMIKIFADGVIESHTAALLAPYLDTPGNAGPMNVRPGLLDTLVVALDSAGFQIHVHAIGDRAIRSTLDALALARQENGVRDTRPTIAHLELIDPADVARFRELGVTPNFQSLWAFEDSYIRDLTVPVLGPERSRWLYPIESVLATGAVVVGGSDWPVSSMNPLDAIQVGVTRRDPKAAPGPAWIPQETAPLADLLAMYTIDGAWLAHAEHETGSIEAGKSADLIVLDKNLFDIPPSEIHDARVLLTMLEGKVIWRDPSFR